MISRIGLAVVLVYLGTNIQQAIDGSAGPIDYVLMGLQIAVGVIWLVVGGRVWGGNR